MSNIEEIKEYSIKPTKEQTIRILKNATHNFEIRGEELYFLKNAIINILAEREQDKKRIEKLEEENKTEFARGYTKCKIDFTKNHIPVQKVKETVKEVIELIESEQFKIIMGDMTKVGRIKYLLEKLLEEK